MSKEKVMRIGEIRGNLWSLLDARNPDTGLEVNWLLACVAFLTVTWGTAVVAANV
ncbi:hypothetical protein [Paenibacillus sp. EZ-K15]|uniref:hypothetical protein n=1 Tax=Paenibacillus sp. EZ-K15 TaxID=2044275 RepID=UPI0013799A9C|nr:hypothetical protein [Paenibacillus sp. EZ-K15]